MPEASTGPNSATVGSRFMSCGAGWPTPPTAKEFYFAVRAEQPGLRQRVVVRAWLREATYQEIMLAWLEEAFSWRILVAAIHRLKYQSNGLNRYLNQFAKPATERTYECPANR